MSLKIKQKILKEIKFLINEAERQELTILRNYEELAKAGRIDDRSTYEIIGTVRKILSQNLDPYLCDHFPIVCKNVYAYTKIPELAPKQTPAPAPSPTPSPSPAPAPPTEPSSGEATGTFITCKDAGSVIKFQKWLKTTYKQNICADGKFGPKTFNAAKKWPNFVFKQQFQALKSDQRELGILCQLMSNGANDDKLWKNQDPTPEKCTVRKSTPSPKPPTQPQTQQDVLRTLAASDTGWQQKMNQEQTNKFVSAYNQNQAFKNAVDAAAKKGVLNTDWIFNNYKNYIRQDLAESYNFYDKQKVDGANLLYEKLIKLYTDKEKL